MSTLVCKGLKLGTSNTQKKKIIYIYINILDPRGSEMFFLYVVLADL